MRKSSKWAHRQQKRGLAVAYGCYPPDADPNPNDVERDGNAVEAAAERERRTDARRVIDGIRSSGASDALVGPWEPRG